MKEVQIPWKSGEGQILAQFDGEGDGLLRFSSSTPNEGLDRTQSVSVEASNFPLSVGVTVSQTGLREEFLTADASEEFMCTDADTFAVLKQ